VAQHDAEDMGASPVTIHHDGGPGAEIDLRLLAGGALQVAEGQLGLLLQPMDKTAERLWNVAPFSFQEVPPCSPF
jgi:hypothetical protein